MKIVKRKALLVFISILALVVSGCQSNSGQTNENAQTEKPSKKIVYGGSSWMAHIPAYVAIKKGFFEEQGLDVEYKSFQTSSARMTALAAGEVDFASTGAISAISLMAAGDKSFDVIGAPDAYIGQEGIVAHAEINSLEDLKGKKVAVTFSSSSHVMLLDLLKEKGLVPNKDVQVLNMAGGDMYTALMTKEIDAAAIWQPYFNKLQTIEGTKVLAKDTETSIYKKYGFNSGPDVLVMRKKFADENPELAQKFLVGYFNAIKWLRDNPREAAEIFVELSELPVEEQEQVIKSITWLDEKDQQEKLGENGSLSQMLEFLADFLYENKQINNDVNVKEWINIESIPQ